MSIIATQKSATRLKNLPPVSCFLSPTRFSSPECLQAVTVDKLKAELAEIDATRDKSASYAHATTPSQFISQALEVEEQQ
jgi:hypothetical protein